MSYNLCFICSQQIKGYFEFTAKMPTTAGTLCEVLQLPLCDNTFTFGQKFLQAPYCSKCVKDMKEMRDMMANLKVLEKQIHEKRIWIRKQLRESCEKRKSVEDSDLESDNEDTFHPLDRFREEVVKEINSLCEIAVEVEEVKESIISGPKRSSRTRKSENPRKKISSTKRSGITISPSKPKRASQIKAMEKIGRNEQDKEADEYLLENVGPQNATVSDSNFPMDTDPDYPNDVVQDRGNASISQKFALLSGTDQVEVQIEEDVAETVNIPSDSEDIYVDATPDGRFICPYAPGCDELFYEEDKAEFVRHIRDKHKKDLGGPSSRASTGLKAPRIAYDLQFKLDAIAYAESHGNGQASRHFSVDGSCVRKWRRQKEALEAAAARANADSINSKVRKNLQRLRLPGGGRKPDFTSRGRSRKGK